MPDTKVIAHRGIRGLHTENSLASFKAAASTNAQAVEFDIQSTRDGQLVVLHTMGSPKKVFGIDRTISEMTWDELKNYRSKDGERIPSFDEVMQAIGSKPAAIDIKDVPAATLLVKKLSGLRPGRISIVNSLYPEALQEIKSHYPQLDASLHTYKHPFKAIALAKKMKLSHITLVLYLLNPLTYFLARRAGLQIVTYQNYASFLLTWRWFVRLIKVLYPGVRIVSDRADKIT